MSQEVWCRLCLQICNDYRSLYDETGHCNVELYEVAIKYFNSTILTAVDGQLHTVMCLECWRHISEFHKFQNYIILAQEQWSTRGEQFEVYIKEEYPSTDAADHLTNGVEWQSNEAIVKSENEFQALSDLEFNELSHSMNTMASSNIQSSLDNPADEDFKANIFSFEETSQNRQDDTDQFLIEESNPVDKSTDQCLLELNSIDIKLISVNEMLPVSNSMERNEHAIDRGTAVCTKKVQLVASDPTTEETIISNDGYIAKWLPTLNCPRCNVACCNFGMLDRHFKSYHPGERTYVECCKRKFHRRNVLGEHCSVHTDPSRLSCKLCGIHFSSRASLHRHMIRQHPKSNDALNYTLRPDKYIDAIVAEWKSNLECELCKESYTSLTLLDGHFKLQHPNEAFHILCCQQRLVLLTDIREHALFHMAHKTTEGCPIPADKMKVKIPYHRCNMCHKSFRYYNKLQDHIVTHSGSGHFKCPYCSQIFKTSGRVYVHLKSRHPDEKVVPILFINNATS